MMVVYIVGPRYRRPEANRCAFERARNAVKERWPNDKVVIPHDIIADGEEPHHAMRISLSFMLSCADCVVFLPDVMDDTHSRFEMVVAEFIRLDRFGLSELEAE